MKYYSKSVVLILIIVVSLSLLSINNIDIYHIVVISVTFDYGLGVWSIWMSMPSIIGDVITIIVHR